jgi:CheY-like chemotaxis protein
MIKVLLVDDEFLVCSYLRQLIDWEAQGCQIVGQAGNGREAMEKVKQLKPELIFLDVNMPEMDGIEFIHYLHSEHPYTRVIILSGYSDYHYVRETMKFGAQDYLLKHELQPEYLIRILRQFNPEQGLPVHVREEDSWRLLRDNGVRRFFETGEGSLSESLGGIRKPVIAAVRLNPVAASAETEGVVWEESHLLRQILATCMEICGQDEDARVVFMGGLRLVFLFPALPAEDASAQERRADRFRGIIQDMLLKYYNICLDWRQSSRIGDPALLPGIYRQLLDQPAAGSQAGSFHLSISQELQIINAVTGKNRKGIERMLDAVFALPDRGGYRLYTSFGEQPALM